MRTQGERSESVTGRLSRLFLPLARSSGRFRHMGRSESNASLSLLANRQALLARWLIGSHERVRGPAQELAGVERRRGRERDSRLPARRLRQPAVPRPRLPTIRVSQRPPTERRRRAGSTHEGGGSGSRSNRRSACSRWMPTSTRALLQSRAPSNWPSASTRVTSISATPTRFPVRTTSTNSTTSPATDAAATTGRSAVGELNHARPEPPTMSITLLGARLAEPGSEFVYRGVHRLRGLSLPPAVSQPRGGRPLRGN